MIVICISALVFVAVVTLHILIHRLLVYRWGIVTGKTIVVYAIGFVVLLWIVRATEYPLTALLFYTLLVTAYLLYFLSYVSEGQSPSAKIIGMIGTSGPLTKKEIVARFTDRELLDKRIDRLIDSQLLEKNNNRLSVSPKGNMISRFFTGYRHLLRWDRGG